MAVKQVQEVKDNNSQKEQSVSNSAMNTESKKKGPGLFAFLFPILLVTAIVFGIWGYFIKANKFGLGEKFRGNLKNIPIIKMILPPNPDPEAAEYMDEDQLAGKYEEFRKMVKDLKKQIEEQKKTTADLQRYKDDADKMKGEVGQGKTVNDHDKKKIDQERKQLQEDKLKFAEAVKNADKNGFAQYFEKIDKEIASQIYEKVLKEKQVDDDVKNYVKTFEVMESANAAKVLENMSLGNMDLVANMMKLMKRQAVSEILANMDPIVAANLSDRIAVEYSIYPEE